MIEEQARYFLNENERGTMMFYLKEYQNKNINVDALVLGLFEILNTHSKVSVFGAVVDIKIKAVMLIMHPLLYILGISISILGKYYCFNSRFMACATDVSKGVILKSTSM